MLRLVSRMVGRASASASPSFTQYSSCSSSCSSTHGVHEHSTFYSQSALRSFSSASSSSSSSTPAASSSPHSSSSSSPPPSSPSDCPPGFYENPFGENISKYSEETTMFGYSKYLIPGPFGTIEKPAIIYSDYNSRIVGCEGGDGLPHELYWFILRRGLKHVCVECGQVFQLKTPPVGNEGSLTKWVEGEYGIKSEVHDHHDGHGHEGDAHKDKHHH